MSNTNKQVPVSLETELVKDIELSPGEVDTANLPSTPLGLESQTKMETDNVPSPANTTKNLPIKFGKLII